MKFPFLWRRRLRPEPEREDRAPNPPNLEVEMCQRHVIRVGSEVAARELVRELLDLGYQPLTKPHVNGPDWDVIAYRWVTTDQLGAVYDEMTGAAERVHGKWEESSIAAQR